MKPGHELDVKVAEALGFRVYEDFSVCAIYTGDTPTSFRVFQPSVDWTSMGLLVEEAKKHGIYLEFVHEDQGYVGRAWQGGWSPETPVVKSAPLAVTIAFMATQGEYITGMDLT